MQWLRFEQYHVEPVIGSLRLWTLTGRLERNQSMVAGKPQSSQKRNIRRPKSQPITAIMKIGLSKLAGFQLAERERQSKTATTTSTTSGSPPEGRSSVESSRSTC